MRTEFKAYQVSGTSMRIQYNDNTCAADYNAIKLTDYIDDLMVVSSLPMRHGSNPQSDVVFSMQYLILDIFLLSGAETEPILVDPSTS